MNPRIVIDPRVCSGKPVIFGTRIMAHQIPSMMAAGYSIADVLTDFPQLEAADVIACLEWASDLIAVGSSGAPSVPRPEGSGG